MASQQLKPEVVPVTVEVGRVGGSTLGASGVTQPRTPRRRRHVAVVAALAAVAAAGAVAVIVGHDASSTARPSAPATTTVARLAPPLSHPAPGSGGTALPAPNSAYVSGENQLLVDPTGHAIARVFVASRCTPAPPLPSIPIAGNGAFRLETTVSGPPRTRVTLSGRFAPALVIVRARFVAPGCDSGPIMRTLRRL